MNQVLVILFFAVGFPAFAGLQEIVTSNTTSRQVWAAQPSNPKALVILFPGGDGKIIDANRLLTNNFLVRTREKFLRQHYSVVIVGTSSWASDGYSDKDRVSEGALFQL